MSQVKGFDLMLKVGISLAYETGKSIMDNNMLCYDITSGLFRG